MTKKKVPKTMIISGKVSDLFFMTIKDENGQVIADYDGYVPSFVPNDGSDYIMMEIDIETGLILGWRNPAESEKFQDLIKNHKG